MYSAFAPFYDYLMQDADYDRRTRYLQRLFSNFGKMPRLLLDLACGTGEFSARFADAGCSVIGVDASEEMLSIAQEKCGGRDILYLCQAMDKLDLYGTVEGTICCLDSLNHITDPALLRTVLQRVALFTEPGGLFIFDVNTPYKHRSVLGDGAFVWEDDGLFVSWRNSYAPKTRIVTAQLDFFTPTENGDYTRTSETICERAYPQSQLQRELNRAGFDTLAVLGDCSMQPPAKNAERVYYVAKRR